MKQLGLFIKTSCTPISIALCFQGIAPVYAIEVENNAKQNDEYIFDDALIRSSSINKKMLEQLSKGNNIVPGMYKVDLYINQHFIEKTTINFVEDSHQEVQPCFSSALLKKADIIQKDLKEKGSDSVNATNQCFFLNDIVDGGSINFDTGRLKLELVIPQTFLKQRPRGYVDPGLWDAGSSIGFVNYIANYYYNSFDTGHTTINQDAAYVSLNGGMNVGKWQFRQQSSLNYSNNDTTWNNIRSYLKRPIEPIKSELSIGQLSSTGRFFSGLSFNGVNLSSDERMLPESMRGYAPVIQGIAKTTARVSIEQNGREIYQTTVAPGPFRIRDLYPTNYNGDLTVTIHEADGTLSSFRVPFSAVPESIRQGSFKYNLDIGRTRDIGEDTNFANITTQYGLNNAITLNNGLRIAEGYQSSMLGTAYTNRFGAFGTEATYSRAKLPDQDYVDGWMFSANYSKTIQPTQTTISLAGYRYSTDGYRDLADVISLRKSVKDGSGFYSSTFNERTRFTVTMNQSLGQFGTLFISGSKQQYRDNKEDDYQLQLGYGKAFHNGVNVNLSVSRQKINYANPPDSSAITLQPQNSDDNTIYAATINIPLGPKNNKKQNLSMTYTHDDHNSYQSTVTGSLGKQDSLSYNLGFSYDDQSEQGVWNAGLQKRLNNANVGINASMGDNYWQSSANIQGAIAVHSGGITLGPYLSDTFALVEAKGAEGAKLMNTQGGVINAKGYTLVPALTPYRFNTISLNPEGISDQIELESGDKKIAPYSGASVKIKFETRQGYAVLIQAEPDQGISIPLGSDVLDENGQNIGIVGQNSQIYLRSEKLDNRIKIQWGDQPDEKCYVQYSIPTDQVKQPLIKMTQTCKVE
ncbi:Outer membrane usher protein FimD precursor [Acinetobacter stercoris]|uniref:Outer membrane usher protein FimD n=1 Tax=Acinetobacter stercoris TaxID=2126983 RepID=A0A2U3MZT8_9GAMM|nr:Outer membrane usher protein FimD precursor [Acinetobacter stercoris]